MIQVVFKPEKAPVVNHESLYAAVVNRDEKMFFVRARNAAEAERKTMVVFRHELTGKLLDFRAEDFPEYDRKEVAKDGEEKQEESRSGQPL